jgi:2',3'-cyclic-nucleotide 2'-phosphodiesterase (5'-nucleotidase family)
MSTFVDFGIERLIELVGQTNFPWLISNVLDAKTKQPLAFLNSEVLIEFNGFKVRLFLKL